MEIIRQDTDYAFRMLVNLAARQDNEPVSTRILAKQEDVSYQFACKIMQNLDTHGIVKSKMGPKGGYYLQKPPSKITLKHVLAAIQGPLTVNKCLLGKGKCPRQKKCPISKNLINLQHQLENSLDGLTLQNLIETKYDIDKMNKI
jgi:Rrf2 family protein